MKTIQPISIWDNGTVQQATVLNAYAVNVQLNNSANFWWGLYSTLDGQIVNMLSSGNLTMSGDAYEQWQSDSYAWDWVAAQLNLTIIGDYVPPVVEELTQVEPESEPIESEVVTESPVEPIDSESEV